MLSKACAHRTVIILLRGGGCREAIDWASTLLVPQRLRLPHRLLWLWWYVRLTNKLTSLLQWAALGRDRGHQIELGLVLLLLLARMPLLRWLLEAVMTAVIHEHGKVLCGRCIAEVGFLLSADSTVVLWLRSRHGTFLYNLVVLSSRSSRWRPWRRGVGSDLIWASTSAPYPTPMIFTAGSSSASTLCSSVRTSLL